jgi:hypothetical protein
LRSAFFDRSRSASWASQGVLLCVVRVWVTAPTRSHLLHRSFVGGGLVSKVTSQCFRRGEGNISPIASHYTELTIVRELRDDPCPMQELLFAISECLVAQTRYWSAVSVDNPISLRAKPIEGCP